MKRVLQTLRFSLRLSAKSPTNTLLCILVLAGSIALVTSMFRLCYMAFLWDYPYPNSDRIVMLVNYQEGQNGSSFWTLNSIDALVREERGAIFSQLIPVISTHFTIRDGKNGGAAGSVYLSWDFAKTFDVKPLIGRDFNEEDAKPGAAPVILISEHFWREHYNADPDVIGKTIQTERTSCTIVGVMPKAFDFPTTLSTGTNDIWLPFEQGAIQANRDWINTANVYGVVKPDVTMLTAEKHFEEMVKSIKKILPEDTQNIDGGLFFPINGNFMPEGFQTMIKISAACSILVLIMGCSIVSGLLTARYSSRIQELAIRSALGATRKQIVAQILIEFSLLSMLAAALGIILDLWMESAVFGQYYSQFNLPSYTTNVNPIFASIFIAAVMFLVTIFSALMPALRASQTNLCSVMSESTRTGSSLRITRLSNFIITTQVAMASVILSCGLMIGLKIHELHTEEKYYDPYEYYCAVISIDPEAKDLSTSDIGIRILRELESCRDIEKAGISTEIYNNESMQWGCESKVWIDGATYADDNQVPHAMYRVVSPGYFNSLNIPILAGRDFTYEDDAKHQLVAAVTDVFALTHYGTTDVIGKGLRMWGADSPRCTIVAVVPDVYNSRKEPTLLSGYFVPYAQNAWSSIPLYVKGHAAPEMYEKLVKDCISKVSEKTVVIKSMNMGVMKDFHGWGLLLKFIFTFFTAFAISALILAGAGLYGVIAFSINMHKLEMGIRLSLGANPLGLAVHVARKSSVCVAIGLVAGALLTVLLGNALRCMFNQFYDGWEVYTLTFTIVVIISLAAILIPAIRASAIEPAEALRDN